jgi:NAD-dependent SIR2 family protein deacetylase
LNPVRYDVPDPLPRWLTQARRITVLTGAGISTDSGIPDFRGPNGVWTRDPEAEKLSNIRHYVADPEIRRRAWQERRAHPAWTARPNAAHAALVDLERQGRLRALLTQNIDGLHQRVDAAVRAAQDCDVFLAIGTSLTVHPVAGLTDVAADSGARVVIVNAEGTPYDGIADLVVREPIGAAVAALVTPPARG